jgi:protein NUD1
MANLDGRSTLPSRASSTFSGSLNSVQHHTAQNRSSIGEENIPEWKRRLARGEDIAGDGCDLFGPTRLEGIFKQPPSARDRQEKIAPTVAELAKPWSMPEQYQSMRASRSRIPEMEVVAEEDEDIDHDTHGEKCSSSRARSLRGVVRDRVLSLEYQSMEDSPTGSRTGSIQRDPRARTSSGLEEIHNEALSPITTSMQNSIREEAIRRLTEVPASALHLKLEDIAERPSSRSSDDGVLYGHDVSRGEDLGEMTSLSLPEDLSMGTQDFGTRGGFINSRRGGRSNDGSFQKKALSSSVPPSLEQSAVDSHNMPFRSSPPPYNPRARPSEERSTEAKPSPTTPRRQPGSDSTDRPRSSGSPLKLFGNYDTFTNDKLLRRLSQFEREEAEGTNGNDETSNTHDDQEDMRISHFGKGDLDRFTFNESIERQPVPVSSRPHGERRIFESSGVDEEIAQATSTPAASDSRSRERFEQGASAAEPVGGETKRVPSSSIKDRTPKRRRTLLLSELDFTQEAEAPEVPIRSINEASRLAGKKRKDARYDDVESAADPATIASRQMLQPRAARPRSSFRANTGNASEGQRLETDISEDRITEELAGELASYGFGITQIANDSRKPSVTTQDFLNEATKIMQIIRQRGKPKSGLSSVEVPREEAEIDPDSILDLDVEGEDTTVDNFSRPPSRNGSMKVRRERMALQDSSVVHHLQKYQDGDELDLLITSRLGSLHLLPEQHAREAALVSLPDDDKDEATVSSPANIRIRESGEHQRKRKHSTSTLGRSPSPPTHASSGTSTGTTIPTCSSANSGNKGRIPPGMVLVPEHVGVMTFDHTTKSWVREKGQKAGSPSSRKEHSEEDPLGEIPDLSIDEQEEAARNAIGPVPIESTQGVLLPPIVPGPIASSRPQTREGAQTLPSETASGGSKFTGSIPSKPGVDTRATSWATVDSPCRTKAQVIQSQEEKEEEEEEGKYSDHDEEVEHEIRILDGRASEAPPSPHRLSKKARAVTIAFSSPLVSAIAYHNERTHSEIDLSVLSADIAEDVNINMNSPAKTPSILQGTQRSTSGKLAPAFNGRTFVGRPVSRIDEQDEENAVADLSVVHISHPSAMTPAPKSGMIGSMANNKGASIICLTPLSEFSLHQVDQRRHLEASYVGQRAHPTSLQQAHGSLALAVDDLMKAITDAEPYELYWEHIRRLDLTEKKLTTLHSLEQYCSAVEELRVSGNELGQLSGVSGTVRTLLVQNNCLSSLTSWGHLQNLQYLDISGNVLESLDGLSCLIHLRELKATNNRIRNLEGILDLNGLLHLELQANQLASVDFEGGELTRLHHLDLSNNQLTGVRHVDALPALRTLYLEKNKLGGFGAPNEQYAMLRDLRLSCNHIEKFNLACIPSIEILYLDHNRIHSIQGLSTARHLNTLSVREQSNSPNLLNTVLSESNECRKLYLSNNSAPPEGLKISTLPHLNLRYLELASCGLTFLPHDFGKKIPNCRTLNLNFNAIQDLQPLKSCGRLNKLMVAGNRLNKLRRTCMILIRLSALTKIDLRDNPLTVGFYPPFRESRLVIHGDKAANFEDPYALPPVDQSLDSKWISHLDEGTRMKRRTIELFLAKGCEKLIELDGLSFDRVRFLQQDEIWRKLASVGVLQRPSRRASTSHGLDDEEALPLDAEGNDVVDDREGVCLSNEDEYEMR